MKKVPTTFYLQLPFHFDEHLLVKDLQSITSDWKAHHYWHNYEGEWSSIALLSVNGDDHNISVHQNLSHNLKQTKTFQKCSYLQQVLKSFKCPIVSVRLLRLTPGSIIKAHEDYQLGYENDNFRLHIPITTNSKVEFILNDTSLPMKPGECWYTNVNFTHSVANKGKSDRVHLVIDAERNAWSDELFFSLAPKKSFAIEDQIPKEVLQMMIRELKNHNEPASKKLLIEYERKLANC